MKFYRRGAKLHNLSFGEALQIALSKVFIRKVIKS